MQTLRKTKIFKGNQGASHATLIGGNSRFNNNTNHAAPGKSPNMSNANKIKLSPKNQYTGHEIGNQFPGQNNTYSHKSFNLAQNKGTKQHF